MELVCINREKMTIALPTDCYSDHCKATVEDGGQGIPVEEIQKKECGQQASGTAARRWRWQYKTELDEDKCSVTCAPQGISQVK